ncbi:hypothetical protein GCM10012289_69950 [Nonomuraea cavernae]|uniref:Uncharacterized protein n=1 Tax=Nonomuraea cavernae TaxID=2045107 RepID=A0A918DTE4_9ACTN|nr:hypothetical protein GCM10012289_69950 [Nonomuraea cavernae]
MRSTMRASRWSLIHTGAMTIAASSRSGIIGKARQPIRRAIRERLDSCGGVGAGGSRGIDMDHMITYPFPLA